MSPVAFDPVHNYISTLFNVTSVVTTTGYASEDYSAWGPLAFVLFFFLMFIGGCSGSTSGGMKRSEEHTSERQSRPHLVCRLLLEIKKIKKKNKLDLNML